MDAKIAAKVNALIKKAQESGKTQKGTLTRNTSSLHKIIKTKEQASTFMKLLQSA